MQPNILLVVLIGASILAAEEEPAFGSYSNSKEGFKTTTIMLLPKGKGELSAGGMTHEIAWQKKNQKRLLSIIVPAEPQEGELSARFEIDPPRLLLLDEQGEPADTLRRLEDQSYFHLAEQVAELGEFAEEYRANRRANERDDSSPETEAWFLVLNTTKNRIQTVDLGNGKTARIVCEIANTLNFSIKGDFKSLEFGHTWISRPDARNSRLEALGEQPPKKAGDRVIVFTPIHAGRPVAFSIGSWTATIPFTVDGREFEYTATFLIRLQDPDERNIRQRWLNAQVPSHIPTYTPPENQQAEQVGTGQPATRPESKSEGGDKPQPEAEGRSR
jgi:hypothetical protein